MKWLIVVALMFALGLMLAGCSTGKIDSQKITEAKYDNKMFMTISDEYCGLVLVDKSTRVMYWFSNGGHSCGILTLLVNPDGTPRIWEAR